MSAVPVPPAEVGCNCCGAKTSVYVTKAVTLASALAAGLFCTHEMMYYSGSDKMRWHLIYFYLTVLSLLILTAEFNLLRHRIFRAFGQFLTTNTGRGITYFFMGGLMILNGTYGLVIGICLMVAGVMTLFSWCFFPDQKNQNQDYVVQQAAESQRQRI